jgi:hypothetical protein
MSAISPRIPISAGSSCKLGVSPPTSLLHSVKMLLVPREVAPISTDDEMTRKLGWIATVIPRIGIVRPF